MTIYYIEHENKIALFDSDKQRLEDTILFKPELKGSEIQETSEGYTIYEFELMTLEEAEEKEAQKKREELNQLFLTGADVERAIYKDKGMDFEDLVKMLEENPPLGLDIKALKIELKANNFYRGNPYVISLGQFLGYSSDDLDYLFKNGQLPTNE